MRCHAWSGGYERAIQEAPALFGISGRHPWALGLLGWTYGKADRPDHARAVFDELEGRSRHEYVSPAWIAITAGSAGLNEDAMQWAERARTERDPLVLWARNLPFWDPVRTHPRFMDVMRDAWE